MKRDIYYKSSNGENEIYAVVWECENPKYILQIAHGMSEHIDRYEDLALFLNQYGIIVAGNNHLGHGKTAELLGYFGKNSSIDNVILDVEKLSEQLRNDYNLDIYYMGHSMGSFIMRYFISKYKVKKCIFMGTGYISNTSANLLGFLAGLIEKFRGDRYISKMLLNMTTGAYSRKISEGMFDWISHNKDNVRRYIMDIYCGSPFTANGYKILAELLLKINSQSTYDSADINTKILFLSGSDDPVGGFKKGVRKVYNRYKKNGFKNVKINLYKNMRHEILHEDNKEIVYDRILSFLEE